MTTQQTRYKLTKKIPTVDVDIALLKNIESYILSNIPRMFEVEETEISITQELRRQTENCL